jgi:rare lipoprotein A
MARARSTKMPFVAGLSAMLLALALSGCAESTLVGHTAKSMFPEDQEQGGYKVGTPYQIEGTWYTPKEDYSYQEVGLASWYGKDFHGKRTANGEKYDMNAMTAAHRTLPMPSLVRVTNVDNGRSAILRVNDRGPFARSRVLDVSKRAADALGFIGQGTATVRVEILAEESIALKTRLLRGESDFATAPTPVAPLAALGPSSQVTASELPPPAAAPSRTGASSAPAGVLAAAPPAVAIQASTGAPYAPSAAGGQFVQIGAFSDPANAERLRTQLSVFGPVSVAQVRTASGTTLNKVRLGPFTDPMGAQAALANAQRNGFPEARLVYP